MKLSDFFVTGEPMIYGADVAIVVTSIAVLFVLTYFKKWGWLWREWLTTVDHKKIGIMYLISALLMLFRGGVDALMMRAQLSLPNEHFLDAQHYNGIFTTHGTIMILFMAMPFIIGLMNIAVPLQIGARDVAFPYLNAISFWTFFFAAFLFNLSFVIGGSPTAGWTAYVPLADKILNPGVGQNFYLLSLQITGAGTLATGINFFVTIMKMRAPGMTLMKMPIFSWSILVTSAIIIFAFPILAIALALMLFDRIFGAHFFTLVQGGMPMMWVNLFWLWGHPEVYIVILPAFGVFSEVISTFSGKKLFGYKMMVWSMVLIGFLSLIVWVHHFFTMGAGPGVNTFFSITTMLIAIPTGIKIFNWLGTMFRGRLRFTTPMLWSLAFIPCFVIGGVTGVMLAMATADYQYHNTYFLVAHFHYVLIAGTVFGCIAGFVYWYPKMFGHMLDEKRGKWAFWLFVAGFNICFMPMFFLGLDGMPRRIYTYSNSAWTDLNLIASLGAALMGLGFVVFVYTIIWSARYGKRDTTGDPWNGRTLEWSTPSPVPHYNFAKVPPVSRIDEFWYIKQNNEDSAYVKLKKSELEPIHMPNNSYRPFVFSALTFVVGFALCFSWFAIAIAGLICILITMGMRSFEIDNGHYVSVKEIVETQSDRIKGA
ncbi:MAG TPA: cytochrome aa3 quinol oxidase subunit I [Bacillales bacterium]|nr:cytochrome aa3 quinol oxidase subunit I [Bacillales bacterium]